METVNITLKIEKDQVINFENWLRENLEIIDFKILPDTLNLYNNDVTFQKLVKIVKKAQKERDKYINDHNK